VKRHHNLDYLRGFAALGIMIYHYSSWEFGHFSAQSVIGRIGIYGVSVFYILSGLTLFLVYHEKMEMSINGLTDFFKKRILRIFPLLWLTIFLTLAIARRKPDPELLFINLTGLFGFIRRDAYIPDGAWSIGNELVFYLCFPLFILFSRKNRTLMFVLSVLLLSIYLFFAFVQLTDTKTLANQWIDYINPFNQVFLFLSGFLIGYYFKDKDIPSYYTLTLTMLAVVGFTMISTGEDPIFLVTGINRIVFSLICILICFSFFKFSFSFPQVIHAPLSTLGEISYSLYLLHPLVFTVTSIILQKFSPQYAGTLQFPISVLITLAASYFVYQYIERYFMKLGRTKQTSPVMASKHA
jgi:exopolysaccharide production protein ExoZ